jgi:spermidine/putrescine-binding protein
MTRWDPSLTRRQALTRLAGISSLPFGASLLAACGGDDSGSATSASTPASTQGLSPAAARERLAGAAGTVRTLLWDGYADPKAYAALLDSGAVKLRSTPMASDEDAITKRGSYDVSVGVDGVYPTFQQAGVALPLDPALLPNTDGLLQSDVMFEPGTTFAPYTIDDQGRPHGMPFAWGLLSATYNTERVKALPETIDDFLKPEFAGKFGLGDDGPRVIGMVARSMGLGGTDALGRSPAPYLLTDEDMDKVFAKLEQLKERAQNIVANPYGEFASSYARGEIIAAFPDWPPTAATAQDGGLPVETAIVDGAIAFMDNFFISADVEPSDAMYAFLNQAIDETTQYETMKALAIAPVNANALDRLAGEGPAWALYRDVDAVLEQAPTAQTPPAESDEYLTLPEWLSRWEQFKAS